MWGWATLHTYAWLRQRDLWLHIGARGQADKILNLVSRSPSEICGKVRNPIPVPQHKERAGSAQRPLRRAAPACSHWPRGIGVVALRLAARKPRWKPRSNRDGNRDQSAELCAGGGARRTSCGLAVPRFASPRLSAACLFCGKPRWKRKKTEMVVL